MKKTIFAIISAFAIQAQAGIGFDGCYQLYRPSTMYPAFCLEGTAEEGINGAGTRLVIFHTNTDRVSHCSKSSGSGMTVDTYTYELNGKVEMTLEKVKTENGRKEGEAVFGKTRLNFLQIDDVTAERLMKTARANELCVKANW